MRGNSRRSARQSESSGRDVDVVEHVKELTYGRGPDVVITATAASVAQEQAIQMAARRGRISFFGGLPKTSPVQPVRLEPGALPRADDHGRQRLGPVAQQAGTGVHL